MLPYLRAALREPEQPPRGRPRVAPARRRGRPRERRARRSAPSRARSIFCSGATEANNLALRGLSRGRPGPLLVSAIEHPSVLECAEDARARRDARLVDASGDAARAGSISAAFTAAIARGAAVVAVMAANNETGVVQPIDEVGRRNARARGVPLHVDAVQALGKTRDSRSRTRASASASFSSHKIGGPEGSRARSSSARGWRIASRDSRRRPGTRPARRHGERRGDRGVRRGAVDLAREELDSRRARLAALEARFLAGIAPTGASRSRSTAIPLRHARVPGTLNLRFPGFSGEGMLFGLDLLGVSVSLGSACSSGAAKPSHVLAAMGVSKQENLESVRFSLGPSLAESDVEMRPPRNPSRCCAECRGSARDSRAVGRRTVRDGRVVRASRSRSVNWQKNESCQRRLGRSVANLNPKSGRA